MAGRRAAAALLLLATAAALSAAAPAAAGGQSHLPRRRRLAQLGFPKPESCNELSENDFASAFSSLDASCPLAEPWSCEGACFDGMHAVSARVRLLQRMPLAWCSAVWGSRMTTSQCSWHALHMLQGCHAPACPTLRLLLVMLQLNYKCARAAAIAAAQLSGLDVEAAADRM